ncbi:MAG: prohibitin family protein [Actinobacteria bacterium]|nr:prohibitin family protein [Actinomycetota bacterium]
MTYINTSSEEPPRGPGIASRLGTAVRGVLVGVGLRRPRGEDGEPGPRAWGRLLGIAGGALALWLLSTCVVVVPAGSVGVPVTLGHAGSPLGQGFHVTPPLTSVANLSARTTEYTMSASVGEGTKKSTDDSVLVLGADGASGSVDSTVLFRLEPERATDVWNNLGKDYVQTLIRPSARTCIRSAFTDYSMVDAATTAWHDVEADVESCMTEKVAGRGIVLEDFQLREVRLEATLQAAVTAKTAAEQDAERQQFELQVARQKAEITRVEANATADAQQILACGGEIQLVEQPDGTIDEVVVPLPIERCSQAQLTPQYLQWTYIQALQGLVDSPNNSTIILPFDQALTPLLQIPGGEVTTTPGE